MKNKLALGCWTVGVLLMMGVACSADDDDDSPVPRGGSGGDAGEGGDGTAGKKPQGGGGATAGSGGSGGTDAGSGGTAGGAFEHSCSKPLTDPKTGLVTCEEGYRHRATAVACGAPAGSGGEGGGGGDAGRLPRAGQGVVCDIGQGGNGGANAGECDAFEHGFCKEYNDGFGGAFGVCRSGCVDDAECGPGFVCICDEADSPTGGACKPASCATDADCGAGLRCSTYDNSCNPEGFACQVAADECQSNADCAEGTCNWNATEARHFCDPDICAN